MSATTVTLADARWRLHVAEDREASHQVRCRSGCKPGASTCLTGRALTAKVVWAMSVVKTLRAARRGGIVNALDVLRGARALLADPQSWCQGPLAIDADGNTTKPHGPDEEGDALAPDAVAWCLVGAAQRAAGTRDIRHDGPELASVRKVTGTSALGMWNDFAQRTHAEVIAALDAAITLEEQR